MPPWEKYQQSAAQGEGPWARFAAPAPAPQAEARPVPSGPDETTFAERLGMGAADPIHGTAQAIAHLNPALSQPQNVPEWARRMGQSVGANPPGAYTPQAVDAATAQREQEYQARRGENAGSFDGVRTVGNVVTTLPLTAAMPAGSTVPRAAAWGAFGGATTGAVQPVTEGDFATEKGKQVAVGAGLGAPLGAVGRAVSPNVSPEVQMMKDAGVKTLTPGQAGGPAARWVENKAAQLPFIGDMVAKAQQRGIDAANVATLNRGLREMGEEMPKGVKAGNEAVDWALDAIETGYQKAYSSLAPVKPQPAFGAAIREIKDSVPDEGRPAFQKFLNDNFGPLANLKEIPGETLGALREKFRKEAMPYLRSQSVAEQKIGQAYQRVSDEIFEAARNSSPEAKARFDALGQAYAKITRASDAAAKDTARGVFSPAQYAQTVKAGSGNRAASRGDALEQDWSQAMLKVFGPSAARGPHPVANVIGMGGAPFALPYLTEPLTLSAGATAAALYSPLGQRAATWMQTGRQSAMAKAYADALARGLPIVGGGLAANQTQ